MVNPQVAEHGEGLEAASYLFGGDGDPMRLVPVAGRRLGQWQVHAGARGLPGDGEARGGQVPLNYALLRLNATPIGLRYPVLAAGDALSVGRVRARLVAARSATTLPMVLAGVSGLDQADGRTWVYFLDRAQLEAVDELGSSTGRRALLTLDEGRSVTLHSGERLTGVYVYAAENGEAPALRSYDQLRSALTPPAARATTGVVRTVTMTPDDLQRQGQLIVRLSPADADRLGGPELVTVYPAHPLPDGERIAVVGRLLVAEVADGVAQADQGVRNAIGVEVGEQIAVTGAKLDRRRWFDALVGRPAYVTCRVQSADLTTVEREVGLVDALTLGLLGVVSGDEVVVEGIPGADGAVPSVRMKAFQASDDVLQRRTELSGGTLACRFPSSVDSLGVFPDLPWVFLDSSSRTALGLAGQKIGTVRIRPSRTYQAGKEAREILLVLAVAFLGLAAVFDNPYVVGGLLAALVLIIGVVVTMRMRSRLSRRLRRRRH